MVTDMLCRCALRGELRGDIRGERRGEVCGDIDLGDELVVSVTCCDGDARPLLRKGAVRSGSLEMVAGALPLRSTIGEARRS